MQWVVLRTSILKAPTSQTAAHHTAMERRLPKFGTGCGSDFVKLLAFNVEFFVLVIFIIKRPKIKFLGKSATV
jgi:hypothetical protein